MEKNEVAQASAELIQLLIDRLIDDIGSVYKNHKDNEADPYCHQWPSWLTEALSEERFGDDDDDDEVLYQYMAPRKYLSTECQTDQPLPVRLLPHQTPAPCESTRQTLFFDALSPPTGNALGRPPLADRFCYMLTDFASALYCSLAIMCCCSPNMLR